MQWTDRIRQVKIVLVIVAVVIAVASLLVSHFLVRDLSNEERHRMEVWAQALRSLNEADETTDLSLVLSVMEGNNTIPVVVLNEEGGIDDYRNIEDTVNISKYAQRMMKAGDTIRVGSHEAPVGLALCAAGCCAHLCSGCYLCIAVIETG